MKNKLKEIRLREYMMTSQDFAKMLNISRSTYSNWELGVSKPNLDTAIEISQKLNKTVNDIWYLD